MDNFSVEATYRNIAVYQVQCFLLCMKWREHYYVDLALIFGLCSAPYIFNTVAECRSSGMDLAELLQGLRFVTLLG